MHPAASRKHNVIETKAIKRVLTTLKRSMMEKSYRTSYSLLVQQS